MIPDSKINPPEMGLCKDCKESLRESTESVPYRELTHDNVRAAESEVSRLEELVKAKTATPEEIERWSAGIDYLCIYDWLHTPTYQEKEYVKPEAKITAVQNRNGPPIRGGSSRNRPGPSTGLFAKQ